MSSPGKAVPEDVRTLADLAQLLRTLRRRDARMREAPPLTYREIAAKLGCSHTTIADYFTAKILPPTDRFDLLVRLLGAAPAEQGAFATARDRVEDSRHYEPPASLRTLAVPRQLPRALQGFFGRADELAALDSLLVGGRDAGSAMVLAAITGTAGVGKTTLAVHWARQVADRYSDGQLYANLRGFDPGGSPVTPAEVVRGFLEAFEVAPQRIPAGLDAQAALYRSIVADRRVLVLLDNARDTEQVRPLLPGTSSCLAIVTSRNRLTSLITAEGAHPVTLDLLSTVESRDLLAGRLGTARVSTEPQALDEMIAMSARLPLALSIVAARAATHPAFRLADLVSELRATRSSLDAFDGGDPATDIRAVFSWSYRTLSPAAARLFRLLGLAPGAVLGSAAAASLAGLPVDQVRPLLAELTRTHLATEAAPGRYTCHDLLRAYAAERAREDDPADEHAAATGRLFDHYLHTAHAAARLLAPHREPIALEPRRPGVTVTESAAYEQALAWFTAEHANLRAVVRHAVASGADVYVGQLAWALTDFLDFQGHWSYWVDTQHLALDAARRLDDPAAQIQAHRGLGRAYTRLGRFDDARTHLQRALDWYHRLGDDAGQAYVYNSLVVVLCREKRHAEALDHARHALDRYQAAGLPTGQATALNAVGWIHGQLGEYQQALGYCQRALTLFEHLGDRYGQADAWDSLGYAHHHLGDHGAAITCYGQALDLLCELGNRHFLAETLIYLGDAHRSGADPAAARDAWQRALPILEELDHPDTERIRARLHSPD
jgi:tetratricopeptide (TPR) repeat protein